MDVTLLLLLATLLWGVWGVANKMAVSTAHPLSVQWMSSIPYIVFIPIWYWMSKSAVPNQGFDLPAFLWALLAAVATMLASLLLFYALQSTPASVAVATTSAYPIVTLIIGVLSKEESLTPLKVIGILLIIGGVTALQWSK
jgi:drug/metabolite transporter (DMT)-like permease